MSRTPRDLVDAERRMASVRAVRQVMQAVWALARAQLPRAERAAAEATTYLDWVEGVVRRLAGEPRPQPAEVTLWVVVGPERALCGSLARSVLDQVPREGPVGLVGDRLADTASTDRALDARVVFRLGGATGPGEVGHVAERIADAILAFRAQERIVLLHPEHGTERLHRVVLLAGGREPVVEPPETWSPFGDVLEAAVIEAVRGRLGVAVAEAMRTEVRARLAAAEAARAACDEQLQRLDREARTLRMGAVTQELLELVGAQLARR